MQADSVDMTSGVPREYATASDFIMVRAQLVKYLGGGNQALVFTLVSFRCEVDGKDRVSDPAGRWWRASLKQLSAETGLTVSAVRTALTKLVGVGALESAKHNIGEMNAYDQVRSYRPVWSQMHLPPTTNVDLPDSANEDLPGIANEQLPGIANLSITQDIGKTKDKKTTKNADAFDEFWSIYPRRQAKGAARTAFAKAVKETDAAEILEGARRYAADPNRVDQFTAHASTWLNQERWGDDPQPSRVLPPTGPCHPNGVPLTSGEIKFAQSEARMDFPDPRVLKLAGIPLTDQQRRNLGMTAETDQLAIDAEPADDWLFTSPTRASRLLTPPARATA